MDESQKNYNEIIPMPEQMKQSFTQIKEFFTQIKEKHIRTTPKTLPDKPVNPGLASVLSFIFPGLGHIYLGQITSGAIYAFLWAFSWSVSSPIPILA